MSVSLVSIIMAIQAAQSVIKTGIELRNQMELEAARLHQEGRLTAEQLADIKLRASQSDAEWDDMLASIRAGTFTTEPSTPTAPPPAPDTSTPDAPPTGVSPGPPIDG